MKVDLFDFDLPAGFIADRPLAKRDEAKLLLVPELISRQVKDLVDILPANSLMIFNNTRVIPAKIHGISGGRKYEIMLHKNIGAERGGELSTERWLAFIKNSKKLSAEDVIRFDNSDLLAVVEGKRGEAGTELSFNKSGAEFFAELGRIGEMPLPPYIKRKATKEDEEAYQTIYASTDGAVASPTAGLHFTPELMDKLHAKGIDFAYLTLHVGAGTFQPVKAEDTREHKMHSEYGIITEAVARRVNEAKRVGKTIAVVGTTSLRLLESAAGADGLIRPFEGKTDIFITPPHRFRTADYLMTNFHLPRSTLFMLVSAFAGMEEMKKAYNFAKENNYRFYSYGDSSLLKRKDN